MSNQYCVEILINGKIGVYNKPIAESIEECKKLKKFKLIIWKVQIINH